MSINLTPFNPIKYTVFPVFAITSDRLFTSTPNFLVFFKSKSFFHFRPNHDFFPLKKIVSLKPNSIPKWTIKILRYPSSTSWTPSHAFAKENMFVPSSSLSSHSCILKLIHKRLFCSTNHIWSCSIYSRSTDWRYSHSAWITPISLIAFSTRVRRYVRGWV